MQLYTAIIAEDESLLAENLRQELAQLWPELSILKLVENGKAALSSALELKPDICFLDIRMPGMSGLEVASALAEDWPDEPSFPQLVFVTAYEQYALNAFEHAALDYIVKPVQEQRLAQTCLRLKAALELRARAKEVTQNPQSSAKSFVEQLRLALQDATVGPQHATVEKSVPLRLLQVALGNTILMVEIERVLYFEAADKYVRVVIPGKEYLIRTSLRELSLQLDMQRFWQIHRSIIVQSNAIERAVKDENGKVALHLKESKDILQVSRMYLHLFKGF